MIHTEMELQWGRDLSVAEGTWHGIWRTSYIMTLQWGRDLSVAEGSGTTAIAADQLGLQWGRDLSVAEGAGAPAGGGAGASFNGAATFRSRKDNLAE